MKISYRTHPILTILEGMEKGLYIPESNDKTLKVVFDAAKYILDKNRERFRSNVEVMSTPFVEALNSARGSFRKLGTQIFEFDEIYGALLYRKISHLYYIKRTGERFDPFYYMKFDEEAIMNILIKEGDRMYYWDYKKGVLNDPEMIYECSMTPVAVLAFKKFTDIQTKEIPANKTSKDIACKYVNETRVNIRELTSRYFTEIHVSGGFLVRGHWRWQPKKKDGEWTKELIWINEFQKEGYHRRADRTIEESSGTPLA